MLQLSHASGQVSEFIVLHWKLHLEAASEAVYTITIIRNLQSSIWPPIVCFFQFSIFRIFTVRTRPGKSIKLTCVLRFHGFDFAILPSILADSLHVCDV